MSDTPAIPAATLVLARDRLAGPPQLLMVERASTMAFAAGMMVFPGGRIDAEDMAYGAHLGHELGGAIIAAVRETIEETAVPVALDPLPSPALALQLQRELLGGASLGALIERHRLTIDLDALTYFTRWLPPGDIVRRFDTWFFLAAAPPGDWHPNVGEEENRAAEWITAAEALERDLAGTAGLLFPTRSNLRRLAQHRDFAAMLADVAAYPPATIMPSFIERDGERWVTIPEGLGYPPAAEPLAGLRRG